MVKMMILFRRRPPSTEFEQKYNDFLVKLEEIPGVRRKSVSDVFNAPHGDIPYAEVVELFFDNRAELETSLSSEAGLAAGRFLLEFAGGDVVTLFATVQEEEFSAE